MQRSHFRELSARSTRGLVALAALLITSSLSPSAVAAQGASSPTPTRAELVAAEIGILELAGGGSLTPEERQQAAEVVDLDMRTNPKVVLHNYALASKVLQRVAKDSARLVLVDWNKSSSRFDQQVDTQAARQTSRYIVETITPKPGFERGDAIEIAIIRRHDPTVVLDRARQHIISEINLRNLDDASAWYAQKVGLPGPSAAFQDHLRDWLKKNYLTSSAAVAAALADEPRNFLYLTDALKNPQHNESAMQALRTKLKGEDPLMRDVSLAIAVADASRTIRAKVEQDRAANLKQGLAELKQTAVNSARVMAYGTLVERTQSALSHP